MDLVTVIIPVFNYGFCLPETLGSLQAQTHTRWEALVVDDGSTDDTQVVVKQLAEHDGRIKYHYQYRRGVSAARNLGIQLAAGEYLLFLDGDDLITPNKLLEHVSLMKREEGVDMSYSDVYYFRNGDTAKLFFSKRGNKRWMIKSSGSGYPFVREFVKKNRFTIHSPLVRKTFLISRKLQFDESLCHNEDWDFWLKCIFEGGNIYYLSNPEAYSLVRVHAQSASYRSINMDIATINIRERIKSYIQSCELVTANEKIDLLKINQHRMRGSLKKMIYHNLHSFNNLREIYRSEPPAKFFICLAKALNEKRKDFFN